jgi:FkbM family methyltransferase
VSTRALLAGSLRQATPEPLRNLARPLLHRWRRARLPKAAVAPSEWREVTSGPLRGVVFWLPPAGVSPLADRVVAGTYEPDLLDALASLASGGGWLYDIGAHVGVVTCAWLAFGGTGVHAFEPLPSNAEAVRRVIERNGLSAAHLHEVALSDREGTAELLSDASNVSTSSMAYLKEAGGVAESQDSATYQRSTAVSVPTASLDTLVRERGLAPPSAIKIDVEGAEGHVVRGAHRVLDAHRPAIVAELHTIDAGVDVAMQLAPLGYRPQLLFHQKRTLCNYLWTAEHEGSR